MRTSSTIEVSPFGHPRRAKGPQTVWNDPRVLRPSTVLEKDLRFKDAPLHVPRGEHLLTSTLKDNLKRSKSMWAAAAAIRSELPPRPTSDRIQNAARELIAAGKQVPHTEDDISAAQKQQQSWWWFQAEAPPPPPPAPLPPPSGRYTPKTTTRSTMSSVPRYMSPTVPREVDIRAAARAKQLPNEERQPHGDEGGSSRHTPLRPHSLSPGRRSPGRSLSPGRRSPNRSPGRSLSPGRRSPNRSPGRSLSPGRPVSPGPLFSPIRTPKSVRIGSTVYTPPTTAKQRHEARSAPGSRSLASITLSPSDRNFASNHSLEWLGPNEVRLSSYRSRASDVTARSTGLSTGRGQNVGFPRTFIREYGNGGTDIHEMWLEVEASAVPPPSVRRQLAKEQVRLMLEWQRTAADASPSSRDISPVKGEAGQAASSSSSTELEKALNTESIEPKREGPHEAPV